MTSFFVYMVSLDGVAARGLVNGRGPSLAMGGMKSELVPTKPNRIYPTTEIHKKRDDQCHPL